MAPAPHRKAVDLIEIAGQHFVVGSFEGSAVSERNEHERLEQALETIDHSRRDALRKLVTTTAFAIPVVVSFAIDGLTVSPALATHLSNATHS
jgi:hypothetical protein